MDAVEITSERFTDVEHAIRELIAFVGSIPMQADYLAKYRVTRKVQTGPYTDPSPQAPELLEDLPEQEE